MIYIVDEEMHSMRPYKIELEIRGYKVEIIRNADKAYDALSEMRSGLDLAIVDVMLATQSVGAPSRFTRMATDDNMKTGLLLMEWLATKNPDNFPQRGLFFSMATDSKLVASIKDSAHKLNIPYLNKTDYPSALRFGDYIEARIKLINSVKAHP